MLGGLYDSIVSPEIRRARATTGELQQDSSGREQKRIDE